MALPDPIIYDPNTHHHLLDQIARIHGACIIKDGTLATFLPTRNPSTQELQMDHDKILSSWQTFSSQVLQGRRDIIIQCTDDSATEVMGYASLWMPETGTGPFRSEVQRLFISPEHRYKGVARRVMKQLEEVAREKKRELIVSSPTPSQAFRAVANVCRRCWTRRLDLGRSTCIPNLGISRWESYQSTVSTLGRESWWMNFSFTRT